MKTRTIRQTVTIPATPKQVYDALMVSRLHKAFTGAKATISTKVGGKFSAWDGYIHGTNVELVPGKRIVQRWRPSDGSWAADHYSVVKYVLTPVRGGTKISFTHSGVPAEHAGHLSKGWYKSYWDPLKKYFKAKTPE